MPRSPYLTLVLAIGVALASLVSVQPAEALCLVCDPASPVPAERYEPDGDLKPAKILGDTTWYKENYEPGCKETNWFDIDVQNGWLFTATGNAVEIWDVSKATEPTLASTVCRPVLNTFKKSDTDFYHLYIDAPPGNDNVVAVGLVGNMGLVVLNTTDKKGAFVSYQDEGETTIGKLGTGRSYNTRDLYVASINNRAYAFVATDHSARVAVYDLTAAPTKEKDACLASAGCADDVYKGPLGEYRTLVIDGAGKYLVIQDGSKKIAILDATLPASPTVVATAPVKTGSVRDVAMWHRGAGFQVAASTGNQVELFDFSCSLSGCSLKAAEILSTPGGFLLSDSEDKGIPYLFVGISAGIGRTGGPQLEYLFDLSGDVPQEVTPQQHPDGYWGWYYEGNDTGFRRVSPYAAVMHNDHLYRAAVSLLDSHKRRGVAAPPVADFSWSPGTIYPHTPVNFSDKSTGKPTSWHWTFENADINEAGVQHPAGVAFLEHGSNQVTLTATNEFGSSVPEPRNVTVLDPVPSVGAIDASPNPAPVCSTVSFDSSGVAGEPPLTWAWEVKDPQGLLAASGSSADSWSWQVPAAADTGLYSATLSLTNGTTATTATAQTTVGIETLLPLAIIEGPILIAEDLGSAQFSLTAEGATEWTWDFGDGQCPAGFTKVGEVCTTTNPVLGAAPTHQYTVGDTDYTVTVKVDNCRDEAIVSEPLVVPVKTVVQLKPKFTAQDICFGGLLGCSANVNQEIVFKDESTGFPESYAVDWTGNGVFEPETPVSGTFTHTYVQASPQGGYSPVLRVTRGSQTETYTHDAISVAGTAVPPSVSVSRSTFQPNVGQTVTFSATASACSPVPTSWNWNAGSGATFSGSRTGNTVNVSYSSAGSRTVRATAVGGGCDGASGSTSVSVQSPDSGGGGGGGGGGGTGGGGGGGSAKITASFTSPATVAVGTEVVFDASGSKSATDYLWDFGDGHTGLGQKVTHVYDEPGDYTVTLEASRADNTCSFGLCVAATSDGIRVTAGGGGPAPTGGNGCFGDLADDPESLCLLDGRFQVQVSFDNPEKGNVPAKGIFNSNKTGFFWFFRPTNVELIVKILNGDPVNGNFWVFYGSLTNRTYEITVTDLASDPIRTKIFTSAPGSTPGELCGQQFTDAFSADAPLNSQFSSSGVYDFGGSVSDAGHGLVGHGDDEGEDQEPTQPTEPTHELLLLDERFRVTVDYRFVNGEGKEISGEAVAVPGTDQSGYFWFFNDQNLEMVVKMVDAREAFGHFWVFWGGLTTAEYHLKVEDTVTNEVWEQVKEQEEYCGGNDTTAFKESL